MNHTMKTTTTCELPIQLSVDLKTHDNHLEANVSVLINCLHNGRLLNSRGEREGETSLPMTQNNLQRAKGGFLMHLGLSVSPQSFNILYQVMH